MKKIFLCIVILSICFPSFAGTTKGKGFWIGFMENISLSFNGNPMFQLHVSCDVATTCTISVPFTGYYDVIAVNANQVYIYTLPFGIFYPQGDEVTANNGVRLNSDDSVEVRAFHHRVYF